jgi:TolA-binding protein
VRDYGDEHLSKEEEMMIHLSKKSAQWVKIIIIFPVLVCALSVYPSVASAQKDLLALVKKVVPSVVVINVFDKGGKLKGVGTGFFVTEDGALVTNYHVIEGGMRAEVKLSNGEVLPVEGIISEDREGDLVLLSLGVKGRLFPSLKLTDTNIEAGQPVVVIGSPFGLEGTVSDGIVSAVRDIPTLGKMLQITAPISKGSSGSPVLNMKGELVGVATSYIKEGQSINFAISADRVAILLSQQRPKGRKFADLIKGDKEEIMESAGFLYYLGYIFFEKERYEEAIPFFKKSILKNPNDSVTYRARGVAYSKLGRYYEAIEALKQSIRIAPSSDAYVNLGTTYSKLGRYNEAIKAYEYAIRIEPDDRYAHYGLGLAYLSVGNKRMALEEYKILKELDVEKANKLFNMIYK